MQSWRSSHGRRIAGDGDGGVSTIRLDLGLPDVDGVAVCRRLRSAVPETVIVVLTARTQEFEVVVALDAGADDCLTKPFRLTELMAGIRAHLRRRGPAQGERMERIVTVRGRGYRYES